VRAHLVITLLTRLPVGLDTLRAYVVGLGRHLDIVARIGNIQLNVA